jgi:hypothetical protein
MKFSTTGQEKCDLLISKLYFMNFLLLMYFYCLNKNDVCEILYKDSLIDKFVSESLTSRIKLLDPNQCMNDQVNDSGSFEPLVLILRQ